MSKINDRGEYLPFYGYTVVSMIDEKLDHVEEYIRNTKTLSQYVTALPASSYHVTIFNIFTHRSVPKKYMPQSGVVPKDSWLDVEVLYSDSSEAQNHCDELKKNISLTKQSYFLGRLPGQPLIIIVDLSHAEEVSKLRKECSRIFEKEDPLEFHVTLGYIFKEIGGDIAKDIDKEIQGLWKLINNTYQLQMPNVCFFDSMERFIPFRTILQNRASVTKDQKGHSVPDSFSNSPSKDAK